MIEVQKKKEIYSQVLKKSWTLMNVTLMTFPTVLFHANFTFNKFKHYKKTNNANRFLEFS